MVLFLISQCHAIVLASFTRIIHCLFHFKQLTLSVLHQLFGLVNTLLGNSRKTAEKDLSIQRYSVIPLSPNSGLIGWKPNCDTLHQLIREYRDARKVWPFPPFMQLDNYLVYMILWHFLVVMAIISGFADHAEPGA